MLYDQAQLVLALPRSGAGVRRSVLRRGRRGHAALRDARDDRRRRRLLLGRGCRQRPAGAGRRRRRAQDGRRVLPLDAPTRSTTLLGDDAAVVAAAVRHRAGRQRAVDPQQEFTGKNLLYIARSRSTTSREHDRQAADEVVEIAAARARLTLFEARLDAAAAASRRQGADRWNGLMIAAFARAGARAPRLGATAARRRSRISTRRARAATFIRERMWSADTRHAAAPLSRRPRGDRRLRRRLRVPDLRAARAVSGRSGDPAWLEWADRAAAPAGRAVLGRGGRRLVQHDRHGSERAAADEGGLRRRRAVGELGLGAEPAGAVAPGATSRAGPSASSGRCGCSARGSSRWAAPCR